MDFITQLSADNVAKETTVGNIWHLLGIAGQLLAAFYAGKATLESGGSIPLNLDLGSDGGKAIKLTGTISLV